MIAWKALCEASIYVTNKIKDLQKLATHSSFYLNEGNIASSENKTPIRKIECERRHNRYTEEVILLALNRIEGSSPLDPETNRSNNKESLSHYVI